LRERRVIVYTKGVGLGVKKQSWIRKSWWTCAFLAVSSAWYGKTVLTKNEQIEVLRLRFVHF
jgi:hypothetical protein